jgi:hypothetical protein
LATEPSIKWQLIDNLKEVCSLDSKDKGILSTLELYSLHLLANKTLFMTTPLLRTFILLVLLGNLSLLSGQAERVSVQKSADGFKLMVDGRDFMINGMNWDYVPIGANITDPGIWRESDGLIRAALDREMALLKNMGVNAIRTYGLPPKWVKYIYEEYGIYTMLNITFGAYGLTVNGGWVPQTDYANPATRAILMAEATVMAETYRDVPGLLLYMIGNENNYHLSWTTAETEDIPITGAEDPNKIEAARALYRAFNDATKLVKSIDRDRPVAICNGDLLYLDIVAQECTDVDIYGTNMYRGFSFGDAFQRVKTVYDRPILFAEFGSDAFNARDNQEDQILQASYDVKNWQEIYVNAAGLGQANNSIGGFTFQFSDGWWKYKQTEDFEVHNNNASWHNGGYYDYASEGENNMNEEWFGICAKGPTDERGLYQLYPRAAYYALQDIHALNPYEAGQTAQNIAAYVDNLNLMDAMLQARGDEAALELENTGKIRLSRLTAELTSYNTGGSLIATPEEANPTANNFPNQLGFDHMQSFYVGVKGNPAPNLQTEVQLNMVGNVAQNPINEIFYENRARPLTVNSTNNGPVVLNDVNRLAVYSTDINWTTKNFDLRGFYRTGHYHWGYEGDFFGLYPEANYGPNIDIYNGNAPLGVEIDGKSKLKGLSLAMGPELWWGANPAVLVKYTRQVGKIGLTGIFHEDLEQRGATESSFAIPVPKTRRATLHAQTEIGRLGLEVGGIWGGQPLEGRVFQVAREEEGSLKAFQDEIRASDTWGGKVKLTFSQGPINWYAQGSAMSLVANGGADLTQTFTGWRLKDNGSGNQYNFLTGFTYLMGDLQIAPNFLWQRPVEGPIPADIGGAGRPRDILTDPFVVRANRETVAGEILFTYDPTPATWMYAWDSDRSEDAPFAISAGFVFRHLPTTQDAAIGILPDGRTFFPFPGAAPAEDLWEAHARIVSKVSPNFGWIANLYTGTAQANGSDTRTINRSGADIRAIYGKAKAIISAKINDWGPFDYHRDFNLTYPEQLSLDLSIAMGKPDWFALPTTQIGIMGIYRTLNQFSPRYCPVQTVAGDITTCDPMAPGFRNGNEWEIRTYLHVNIFQ